MSQQLELLTESPSHWTTVSYVTPEIQKKEIKPFVILALKELEGTPDARTSSLVNVDKFAAVRAVVRHASRLRSAAKGRWREHDLRTFLEGLKFSQECAAELATILCTDHIYDNIPSHLRVKPAVTSLSWRIDLSLHSATRVILIIALTNGDTKTYRLTVAKFHELRYTVASALKSVIVLEKRKCMKKE